MTMMTSFSVLRAQHLTLNTMKQLAKYATSLNIFDCKYVLIYFWIKCRIANFNLSEFQLSEDCQDPNESEHHK